MPKKKRQNYFNNKEVSKKILELHELDRQLEKDKNNREIYNKMRKVEEEITVEIRKIVKAIIMLYSFWRFDDYNDLEQTGIMNAIMNYRKFDPTKGSAFNFFSLIAKKSLLAYTIKGKNYRQKEMHNGIYMEDIYSDVEQIENNDNNMKFFLNEFKGNISDTIEEFIDEEEDKEKKHFIKEHFIDFLEENLFFKKKPFYEKLKKHNVNMKECRNFIKFLDNHFYEVIYDLNSEE